MDLLKLRRIIDEIKREQANIDNNYPNCDRLISPEQYHTIIEAAEYYHDIKQEEIE